MAVNKREPEGIKRKKKRPPQSLEEIERRNRRRPSNDDDEYRTSRKKRTTGKKKKKKKKKGKIIRRILLAIVLLLVLVIGLGIASCISFFSNIDNSDTIASTPPTGNTINVLILGMDIGDTEQVGNDSVKRTDTMMVLNYNKDTKKAQLVSIPRDTLVNEKGTNYKINAAFPKGGDQKVKSVVENILGININYIAKIKYEAFRSFIDAIGGVDMKIERDMIYDDDGQNLHINFREGTTAHLDGQKAEEFFRWRKNNDGTGFATGDLGRIENQHKFLNEVIKKCKTPAIIPKVPTILKSIAENIQTNMKSSEMISLGLKLATAKTIEMATIQGEPKMISGQSYVVFSRDSNKDLLNSLHTGEINETSKKKELKILVLNGTKINGLASKVKTLMEVAGWSNIDTDNTDLVSKSKILANDKSVKNIINTDLPQVTKIEEMPSDAKYEGYDAVIIIGSDYKKLGE